MLDPGHGGANPGAVNAQQVTEKEVTLALAQRVKRLLEEQSDVRVALTREGDEHLGLKDRAEVADRLDAALLLSIHCNSAPHQHARGFETFFIDLQGLQDPAHPGVLTEPLPLDPSEPGLPEAAFGHQLETITADLAAEAGQRQSELLARLLQEELAARLPSPDRGVRQAPYDLLIHAATPAVVVEVGFFNHPQEGLLLTNPSYQEQIARALGVAILSYLQREPPSGQGGP